MVWVKTENITKETLKFEVLSQQGSAWRSIMNLPHGPVKTPVFMPVGTKGTIKGLIVP